MREAFVDVVVELPVSEYAELRRHQSQERIGEALTERLRDAADRKCEEAGGRLRMDRRPEIFVGEVVDRASGEDVILVSSRWSVDVPDDVEVEDPRRLAWRL